MSNAPFKSTPGKLRLPLEAGPIRELLAAEAERWEPQAEARQVSLSLEASGDLPEVHFDRMRMSQAPGNVMSNAIRCTDAGGKITLSAGLESGGTLAITIADDGISIDAADLPRIFERFYRSDLSRSRRIGSTELGLAISRAIVGAHGGTIAVASDGPGRGTTVSGHPEQ